MLCFLRTFTSVIWRNTSNCSTEWDNERQTNSLMLRELRLSKSDKANLLSIIFLLCSFFPVPVFAQFIFGDGFEDAIVVTVPDAPTLNSATAGDESIVLSFIPNFDGGSEITGYIAACGESEQPGPSSPIIINGLTNGVTYSCAVIATNAVGNSKFSNIETATPFSDIAQASITKFEITTSKDPQPVSCGDTDITFEWEAQNAGQCFGSWAESESNPDGLLYGSIDQQTGALYDTESALFENLALTRQFTLKCADKNGVITDQQSQDVEVNAPCLPTINKTWEEVFTEVWPSPKYYQPPGGIRITGDKVWAIKFNTGAVLSETSTSSPITVTGMQRGARYSCSVVASNGSSDSQASNLLHFNPVEMAQASSTLASAKSNNGGSIQASTGTPATTATVPSPPTLLSYELGHLSAELTFTDDVAEATSYTASCRISTLGGVGTSEYSSTRGGRLLAVSRYPGDFQVAEECQDLQYNSVRVLYVKTEGSDATWPACNLEPNTDYYWNITFTDGVNSGTSSCIGTPCQTWIRALNPETEN